MLGIGAIAQFPIAVIGAVPAEPTFVTERPLHAIEEGRTGTQQGLCAIEQGMS